MSAKFYPIYVSTIEFHIISDAKDDLMLNAHPAKAHVVIRIANLLMPLSYPRSNVRMRMIVRKPRFVMGIKLNVRNQTTRRTTLLNVTRVLK